MLAIPENMTEVTKEEFYAALYADPRDIMPSHHSPDYTTWKTKDREVWGWSHPGWRDPGALRRYALKRKPA